MTKSKGNRTTLGQPRFNRLCERFPDLSEAEVSAGFNYVQNLVGSGAIDKLTVPEVGLELRAHSIHRPEKDAEMLERFAIEVLDLF